jgi:hypothetical protein
MQAGKLYTRIFTKDHCQHTHSSRFIADLGLTTSKKTEGRQPEKRCPIWIPPPSGCAKIKVDAATSKNLDLASVAAIARDESGNFIGAFPVVIHGITDPETLEALACREGLMLTSDTLLSSVRIASDCANAARSIHGAVMGSYGHIIPCGHII